MLTNFEESFMLWILGPDTDHLEHDSFRENYNSSAEWWLCFVYLLWHELPVCHFQDLFKINSKELLKFKRWFLIDWHSIFGSHDTRINVWRFNEDYFETTKRPAVEYRVEEVVIFERLIEHHKSGISCLTYDGIDCIISGNTQGSILLIDIGGNLLKELIFTTQFEPITSIKVRDLIKIYS